MQKHIQVSEAVHNGAEALRTDKFRGQKSVSELAQACKLRAKGRANKRAADYWAEVEEFLKAKERAGRKAVIQVEEYRIH